MIDTYLLTTFLGVVVGAVLGLTGAGGAVLSVPFLGIFLHLDISKAAPVGLVAVAISSWIGSVLALRAGVLRYKAALLMAVIGLVFSPLGMWVAHQLPNWPLVIVFIVILLLVARNMWQKSISNPDERHEIPPCRLDQEIGKLHWSMPCAKAMIFSGALAGFFSGLLGVGGGFIIVPALRKFTDLPMKSIVATSMGVLSLVSMGGVVFSSFYGSMSWLIAIPFSIGAIIGLLIGRHFVKKLSEFFIQRSFAILAVLVALIMLVKLVKV